MFRLENHKKFVVMITSSIYSTLVCGVWIYSNSIEVNVVRLQIAMIAVAS